MKELLKELCLINGVSGDESAVRDFIISKVKGCCEYSVDPLGSLICFRKGRRSSGKKLMICAHMDEVGFIVTYINSDGTLCFDEVGGVNTTVALGRQVRVGKGLIPRVTGSTAVHNLSKEQREKAPEYSGMYIDIGARDREEALQYVQPGDCVYFDSEYTEMGGNIKSKAIDDRIGCAMMIRLIQEQPEYDTCFVFNVQEEIQRSSGLCYCPRGNDCRRYRRLRGCGQGLLPRERTCRQLHGQAHYLRQGAVSARVRHCEGA